MKFRKKCKKFGGIFDLDKKREKLLSLEDQINNDPKFWDDPKRSAKVLKNKKDIEETIEKYSEIESLVGDFLAALDLADGGEEFIQEARELYEDLSERIYSLETQSLLSEEFDNKNAILTINAGAGGTESCDWASMILRMYQRLCDRLRWGVTLHDVQQGDEAGIKSATIEIEGQHVYGQLKGEIGVHRLVRISPFDSNARRHTSFASVFVSPMVEDDIEITINPSDLRVDTYRASGAGGQHVNRTDSAVRITHTPSGIVVQCQSQRSQHQNRDTAMKMLKSKLYEKELQERQKEKQAQEDAKTEIGFGSQIRSYVLHPYKMVKDHRSMFEGHDPDDILDGNLIPLIHAYLQYYSKL